MKGSSLTVVWEDNRCNQTKLPTVCIGGQGPPDLPEATDQGYPPAAPAVAAPPGHHVPHDRQGTPTDGEQANGGRVHPCTSWRYVGPQKPAGLPLVRGGTPVLRPHRDGRGTCAQDSAVAAGPTWSGHAWHDGRQSGPSRVALLPPCLTPHYNAAYREVGSTRGAASCACPCTIVSIRLARSTLSPPEGP